MTPVQLLPHDPAWPELAAALAAVVRAALGPTVTAVEHIGNTAVPGLVAKPVLDLLAAAPDLAAVRGRSTDLGALDLEPVPSTMPARLLFVRPARPDRLRAHLHVVDASTWPLRNQRLFRDHLRAHPEAAARYGAAKLAAAADPEAYTAGKTAVVQQIVDAARAPVPVWEE